METGFISTGGYSYPGTNPTAGFPGLGATNNPAKNNSIETSQFLVAFRASLYSLGDFPDKYIINKLTQQAGLHQQLASSISGLIEGMIADSRVNWERKLPLCYLVDSVLKNIGEPYVALFGSGVITWFPKAYDAVGVTEKRSLIRVLGTWEKQSMFPVGILKVLRDHVNVAPRDSPLTKLEESIPSTTSMPLQSQPLGAAPERTGAPALAASVVTPPQQSAACITHAAVAAQQQNRTPADGSAPSPSASTTPLSTIIRLNQTVASGGVLPVAGSTEFHKEVDKLTAELVEEQQEVLGHAKSMSTEELWRAQPDLAMEFRTFAEAQLAEEIRRLSTGGAIISAVDTDVLAAAVPEPASSVLGKEVTAGSGVVEATTEKGRSSVKRQTAASASDGGGSGNRGRKAPRIRQNGCEIDLSKAEQVAEKLLREVGIAASSAGAGETSASQRHTALATKHVSALAGMLGLDLRDGVKMGSGGGSVRGSAPAPQFGGWMKDALSKRWDSRIRALYKDLHFHCKQDGQRFMTQALLDKHMDLLFQRRRAKKENTNASRSWYPTADQWRTDFGTLPDKHGVGGKNKPITGNAADPSADLLEQVALEALEDEHTGKMGKMEDSGAKTNTGGPKLVDGLPVLADEYNGVCKICGETFDMFFSTEEEEWMFKDACYVDVPPRIIVHKACVDEAGVSALRDLVLQEPPTGGSVEEGKELSSNPPHVTGKNQHELGGTL
eukprot:77525_1